MGGDGIGSEDFFWIEGTCGSLITFNTAAAFPKMKFLLGIFLRIFSKEMSVINYDCIKAELCSQWAA